MRTKYLALLLALTVAALLVPRPAAANGGTIALSDVPVGPYRLTAFTSPSPLVTGNADVSVGVSDPSIESALGEDLILDAQVEVAARPSDSAPPGVVVSATHELATNKLLYAANVPLNSAGDWTFDVTVRGPKGGGSAAFQAAVSPSVAGLDLLNFACVVLPLLAFLAWFFIARRRAGRGPAAPEVAADHE